MGIITPSFGMFGRGLNAFGVGGGAATAMEAAIKALTPSRYLKLDDESAPFVDIGSVGVDGTNVGVTPQGFTGPDGFSYARFPDGNSPRIDLGNDSSGSAASNDVTIIMIAKHTLNGSNTVAPFMGKRFEYESFAYTSLARLITTRKTVGPTSGTAYQTTVTDSQYSVNTYHLVAYVIKSSANPVLYVDNSTTPTVTNAGAGGTLAESTEPLLIGSQEYNTDDSYQPHCQMDIAHFALLERAITTEEFGTLSAAAISDGWISA